MKALVAVLAVLPLVAVACGDSQESPDPTSLVATATPETPGDALTISAPWPGTSLMPGNISYLDAYVLDPETGQVVGISRDSGEAVGAIQWIADDTVRTSDGLAISLFYDIAAVTDPVATMTPSVMPDVVESADGLWSAERNLAISGITLTERATGRRFDLPDTDTYQWAPSGHLMATGGGWCGGGRVSVVNPDTGSITQITPGGPEGHGMVYVWRPDGRALALDLLSPRLSLVLVDAATGGMTTLIEAEEYVGEFVPLEWNPSGTHLLFRIHGGRDCGN